MELGETVDQSMKNACLRQLIEKLPNYDKEYVKAMLTRFVEDENERKEEEQRQSETERQERIEIQRLLKSWRGWNEDADDVSDEDSGEELESQRPKRTTRKPQYYQ
ncbi:hypothetical protein JTE90_023681 [Oedothorax gibbosus]|uniref:Uncharacterized protein n=1 Tax=Oedothorax gibbosus TaxID=931172 RepID=A0AAV6TXC6_9ARAC|nr:hypothetical protein JTE90_023681 [Oedothorax gibbosus]